ncbi:hypothetical protein AYO44_14210 [Planctomycetaceae bacterium SCGC AG-212-F19]|nr:hypothetical protein AYO44_14210 [Planctomycetaceae bacterium SCGC AG-212-F19]
MRPLRRMLRRHLVREQDFDLYIAKILKQAEWSNCTLRQPGRTTWASLALAAARSYESFPFP